MAHKVPSALLGGWSRVSLLPWQKTQGFVLSRVGMWDSRGDGAKMDHYSYEP